MARKGTVFRTAHPTLFLHTFAHQLCSERSCACLFVEVIRDRAPILGHPGEAPSMSRVKSAFSRSALGVMLPEEVESRACSQGGCPAGVSAAAGTGAAPICTKATLHAVPQTHACQTRGVAWSRHGAEQVRRPHAARA